MTDWLLPGYLLTVGIELPIFIAGLSACHSLRARIFAAVWLSACTYPVVALTLPALISLASDYSTYILVAEGFAIGTELTLFETVLVEADRTLFERWQDRLAIIAANLASATAGFWLPTPG